MSQQKRHPGVGWQPLERAVPVPLTDDKIAQLREVGATDDLIAEAAGAEVWKNNRYTVTVTRREDGTVQELSIRRNDRRAARDWRDFQRIKSQIAGPDAEAVELYPAEDRLMDTANQYYLWCFPPGHRVPIGYDGARNLRDADEAVAGSAQRELPEDWKAEA
jgi:hypothetical protein